MNVPSTSDSFAHARDQEALVQRLVAEVFRKPYLRADVFHDHILALEEVSDTAMAWWVYRAWLMVARREIPAFQDPNNPLQLHPAVAEQLLRGFILGPGLTPSRAEVAHEMSAQSLLFEPLATGSFLAEHEWLVGTAETPEMKQHALRMWYRAVESFPRPFLAIAVQRLLDPDHFVDSQQTQRVIAWKRSPQLGVPLMVQPVP